MSGGVDPEPTRHCETHTEDKAATDRHVLIIFHGISRNQRNTDGVSGPDTFVVTLISSVC